MKQSSILQNAVFCPGKVFWAMVSGNPFLRFWYWQDPEFSLDAQSPLDPSMKWARRLFQHSIVEKEENCLPTARELLQEVDSVLFAVSRNAQVISKDVRRVCLVCGLGTYQRREGPSNRVTETFGLSPRGGQDFIIFSCSPCGHVELFSLPRGRELPPAAWKSYDR